VALRSWPAAHPLVVDTVLAAVVTAVPLFVEATDAQHRGATLDAADVASSALAFVLIVLRRRAPLPVFAVSLVAAVWSLTPADDQIVLQVAAFLTLYTVAAASDRATAWTAGGIAATSLFLTAAIAHPGPYDNESIQPVAWMVAATALGDAVRSRRSYLAAMLDRASAMQERAERAEQALEEEARRQVAEERLRIARELHDVVAHNIAVINVQAGLANHLVHTDPDGAQEALGHVRRGATSVLDEMADIVSVLRRPDDPAPANQPLPTLDQLDRLIADFTAAGLDVEWQTAGARKAVAPTTGLAAYRIVQESLTNAHRHGSSGRALLRVAFEPDALSIEVTNETTASAAGSSRLGHGIIGIRERVAAAGGTLEIGPTGTGWFRVHATLPVIEDGP
jgi:signal transduction histidine kinase